MFIMSGLIDLTKACIVTALNVTEKRGNIEINNFLREEGKCVNLSKIWKSF